MAYGINAFTHTKQFSYCVPKRPEGTPSFTRQPQPLGVCWIKKRWQSNVHSQTTENKTMTTIRGPRQWTSTSLMVSFGVALGCLNLQNHICRWNRLVWEFSMHSTGMEEQNWLINLGMSVWMMPWSRSYTFDMREKLWMTKKANLYFPTQGTQHFVPLKIPGLKLKVLTRLFWIVVTLLLARKAETALAVNGEFQSLIVWIWEYKIFTTK